MPSTMPSDPLVLLVAGGWVVKYPWERLPLSMNDRLHPMAKAKKTAAARKAAAAAFAGVPAQERDTENCVATLKPWCDGLVDAGLVPDDTPEWGEDHARDSLRPRGGSTHRVQSFHR